MNPSSTQLCAARALAKWTQKDVAQRTGLSALTIKNIENSGAAKQSTFDKIVTAFRNAGIEFTENDGVRRLPEGIEVYEGRDRFSDFMNFMYDYLENYGGDVCIYIQDESHLQRTQKNIDAHRSRMAALAKSGKIKARILAAKGIEKSIWAEIRRIPLDQGLPHVSFFAFGDNLSLISFDHKTPPYVVLHKSGPFASVYKNTFDSAWEKAKPTS